HTRSDRDWSSDVCSSDLAEGQREIIVQSKFARERGHLKDAQQFKKEIGSQQGSDFARIVRRRDFHEIASDDLQSTERANQLENLHAGQSAYLRRSGYGSVGRINHVDIQGDVHSLAVE